MKKLLVLVGVVAVSAATFADRTFKWTGGAGDGLWSSPANWNQGETYPSGDDAIAEFNSVTAEVTNDVAVSLKFLDVKGGDVTIADGGDDTGITMNCPTSSGVSRGVRVTAGGKLTYGAKLTASVQNRFDPQCDGGCEFHFTGKFYGTGSANNKPVYWLGHGKIFFEGDCVVNAPQLYFVFGFEFEGYPYQTDVTFKDNAQVVINHLNAGGNSTAPAANIVQTGNSTVAMTYLYLGTSDAYDASHPTSDYNHVYTLLSGTLTASNSLNVAGKQHAQFVQEGGTFTTTKVVINDNNRVQKAVELKGGTFSANSQDDISIASGLEFAVEGGRLEVRTGDYRPRGNPRITYGGKFALAATATNGKGTLYWDFYDCTIATNSTFVYYNDSHLSFLHHLPTYGLNLEVAEGQTMTLAANSSLTLPAGSYQPMGLKIGTNATFKLAAYTSRLQLPLDLEIEEGGKFDFTINNRNSIVAHSLKTNGVALAKGMHLSANNPWIINAHAGASVIVPRVWTGKGDGTSWTDAGNWADGDTTTRFVDVSAATKTIQLPDEDVEIETIVAMPRDNSRQVTIEGEQKLVWTNLVSWSTGVLVGENCTLSLQVDARQSLGDSFGVIGGGTLRFEKGFPTRTNGQALAADCTVVLAGGLMPRHDGEVNNYLALSSYNTYSPGKLIIEDNVDIKGRRVMLSMATTVMAGEIRQKGGKVAVQDCYIGRYNYGDVRPTYYLEGGELNITNDAVKLNGKISSGSSWAHYPGGSFEMTGGKLTCNGLSSAHNQNYFRLTGGTVYLKGNATASENTNVATKDYNEYSYYLGGVTLVPCGDAARTFDENSGENKVWLSGINGDLVIAPETVTNGCYFKCDVAGPGGIDYRGTATMTLEKKINFTGRLTIGGYYCYLQENSELNGPSEIVVEGGAQLYFRGKITKSPDTIIINTTGNLKNDKVANEMTVKRLVIGGVDKPNGDYTFGNTTVHVVKPTSWLDGTTGNLSFEANGSTTKLTADTTLSSLKYASCVTGSQVTLAPTDGETLTFSDGAVIEVAEGDTLVIDADVILGGKIVKQGMGKVLFNGAVTCPGDVTKGAADSDVYWLTVTHGSADFDGEVTGVRLITKGLDRVVPRITLKSNCHVHDYAAVLTAFSTTYEDTYGETYQEGATIDYTTLPYTFANKGIAPLTNVPYNGSNSRSFTAKYVLNSGTITVPSNYALSYVFDSNGHGTFDFIQNGGTLTAKGGMRFSRDSQLQNFNYTLNAGEWELIGDISSYDSHFAHIYLNGGTVRFGSNVQYFSRENFSLFVGGNVTFETAVHPLYVADFYGTGAITFTGTGTPLLEGSYTMDAFTVDGETTLELREEAAYGMSPSVALSIANGAKLELTYDGIMQVRTFTVDGQATRSNKVFTPGKGTIGTRLLGTGSLIASEGIPPGGLIFTLE